MRVAELNAIARAMVAPHKGILAADESTGTIGKRFASIGIENVEPNRRAYRDMLFGTPDLGGHISAAILYDETIRQPALDGTSAPRTSPSTPARRSPRGSTGCASGSPSTSRSERGSPSGGR